jgi:hypothetical protein
MIKIAIVLFGAVFFTGCGSLDMLSNMLIDHKGRNVVRTENSGKPVLHLKTYDWGNEQEDIKWEVDISKNGIYADLGRYSDRPMGVEYTLIDFNNNVIDRETVKGEGYLIKENSPLPNGIYVIEARQGLMMLSRKFQVIGSEVKRQVRLYLWKDKDRSGMVNDGDFLREIGEGERVSLKWHGLYIKSESPSLDPIFYFVLNDKGKMISRSEIERKRPYGWTTYGWGSDHKGNNWLEAFNKISRKKPGRYIFCVEQNNVIVRRSIVIGKGGFLSRL